MKKQILLLFILVVVLGLIYVIFGDKAIRGERLEKLENIETQNIVENFTNKDAYYGCYWGDVNQKKLGTPSDWVLVYPGTRSAQWCNPKKAESLNASDPVSEGTKIRAKMSVVGCPDEKIVDKMPSVIDDSGVIPPPKAYYIKDGKRVEISEYDSVWVSANCEVPVTEVE